MALICTICHTSSEKERLMVSAIKAGDFICVYEALTSVYSTIHEYFAVCCERVL